MKYGRIEYKEGTDEVPTMAEAIEVDVETGAGSIANAAAIQQFTRQYPTVFAVAMAHESRHNQLADAKSQRRWWAMTRWSPEDIRSLRPDWTVEQAEEFLQENERRIQDRLVELGWEVIECLLP